MCQPKAAGYLACGYNAAVSLGTLPKPVGQASARSRGD